MGHNGARPDVWVPMLRWAGGKTWLIRELPRFLPGDFGSYHEPFIGGGSVFFNLRPDGKAYLSDSNPGLMNAYSQIRDDCEGLVKLLKQFHNSKEEYYTIRAISYDTPLERAAQFFYLNRTCFNGIYRVNLRGEYNVPYGFKTYKQLFDFDRLRKSSTLLKSAVLSCGDFETCIRNIKKGDLVFLDPPYSSTPVKNGFIKYNEKLFSWNDQLRLAQLIRTVDSIGAYYILTNAKHDSVMELFGALNSPTIVERASVIGGRGAHRGMIDEYVFTNTR